MCNVILFLAEPKEHLEHHLSPKRRSSRGNINALSFSLMNGLTKMPDKASVKGYTYINKMLVATILVTGSLEADTADMGI